MRFTSGLFVAVATSAQLVMGQNATSSELQSSEISTTTLAPEPSSSAGPPAPVDLGGAELGAGASLVTVDGKTAVQLSAPANGEASFSIATPDVPTGITEGDLIQAIFDIAVALATGSRKRAATTCTLDVTLNGQTVFSSTLETTSGFSTQTSSGAPAAANQDLQFVQKCGDTPATLQVANLAIGADAGGGGGSTGLPTGASTPVVPTGTSNGTASATGTATGTATGSATGTQTGTGVGPTGTSTPGFPGAIGQFALFGCVGSTAGFPSFSLAQSSSGNDLNVCASLCSGRAFFGVYENDCYCGDRIDDTNTRRVALDQCNLQCPGDATENCGGIAPLQRRQSVSNSILLTVYIFVGGAPTSTATTTFTTTVTGASTTATSTVTSTVECINGVCFPSGGVNVWIFVGYPGDQCDGLNVWVLEDCSCKGGKQYVPKYCSDGSCNGLTVYKAEECDDWVNYDVVYCPTVDNGKVVAVPWENTWGTPAQPNQNAPAPPASVVPGSPSTTPSSPGTSTPSGPAVVTAGAGKQVVSSIAYIAAAIAAFL